MNEDAYSSTRGHDDACYVTQQWQQNQDFAQYYLTNHRDEEEKTRIGMTRWGGHGIPATLIDYDSDLRQSIKTEKVKTSNFRTDCFDYDGSRTSSCSAVFGMDTAPSGINAIQQPAEPQQCRFQDQLTTQCATAFNQVTEHNPNRFLPISQIEPWTRGGIITRHNLRNKDKDNKDGKTKQLYRCTK